MEEDGMLLLKDLASPFVLSAGDSPGAAEPMAHV